MPNPSGRNGTNPKSLADFWIMVEKSDQGCWNWTGALFTDGYGQFGWQGKNWRVHRFMLAVILRKNITGVLVRHKCDNPLCVNPKHLIVGSHIENMADMTYRQRQAHGERQHDAKITNQQALQLRHEYALEKQIRPYGALVRLATRYGLPKQLVYRVVSKQTFKLVQEV